mmetsp:Transcript_106147/g.307154  ORF Transcript_106147/g.307154 Transcript_106147/m.307154 type:complete len:413 (+) Transcript_106147:1145-2383(+)
MQLRWGPRRGRCVGRGCRRGAAGVACAGGRGREAHRVLSHLRRRRGPRGGGGLPKAGGGLRARADPLRNGRRGGGRREARARGRVQLRRLRGARPRVHLLRGGPQRGVAQRPLAAFGLGLRPRAGACSAAGPAGGVPGGGRLRRGVAMGRPAAGRRPPAPLLQGRRAQGYRHHSGRARLPCRPRSHRGLRVGGHTLAGRRQQLHAVAAASPLARERGDLRLSDRRFAGGCEALLRPRGVQRHGHGALVAAELPADDSHRRAAGARERRGHGDDRRQAACRRDCALGERAQPELQRRRHCRLPGDAHPGGAAHDGLLQQRQRPGGQLRAPGAHPRAHGPRPVALRLVRAAARAGELRRGDRRGEHRGAAQLTGGAGLRCAARGLSAPRRLRGRRRGATVGRGGGPHLRPGDHD